MDGNNQILPLAYGIGKTKSAYSWSWFLSKLRRGIPLDWAYTFVSDKAIREVFPESHHVLCCRHLKVNLNLKAAKVKKIANLFRKACKSYTVEEFELWYGIIATKSPRVYNYLQTIDKTKWTRACFAGHIYNIMTSNSAESMNSLSRHARKLPIVMLIEFFRTSVQEWFYKHRNEAEKLGYPVTSWAQKKIKGRMSKCATWPVHGITKYTFQVADPKKMVNIVDTQRMTCDCRKWNVSGLPCGHAIAVANFLRLTDASQWSHVWYPKENYVATYNDCINPVPDRQGWHLPPYPLHLLPPLMDKRQAGRPKLVKRIPTRGEVVIPNRCSRCGDSGHKRNSCTMSFPSQQSTTSDPNKSSPQEPTYHTPDPDDPNLSRFEYYGVL